MQGSGGNKLFVRRVTNREVASWRQYMETKPQQMATARAVTFAFSSLVEICRPTSLRMPSGTETSRIFLDALPIEPIFDLVVTSPPYNIGKSYEVRSDLDKYLLWQSKVVEKIVPRLKPTGSLCWQVGNFIDDGEILPLDIEFAPIFRAHKLQLRNRIVWHFGHGLHTKRRFSGRYEVVMWYTKTKDYVFNLDAVRIPAKYPGKRHFKGPKAGELSGNPLGKNPEDVWFIPNCKSNHVEKTEHPCQFPVGLIERLILAFTKPRDEVVNTIAAPIVALAA